MVLCRTAYNAAAFYCFCLPNSWNSPSINQAGRLHNSPDTRIPTGPSSPATVAAAALTGASTMNSIHEVRLLPTRRRNQQDSASGNPAGATGSNDAQTCADGGSMKPLINASRTTPAGNHSRENARKARRFGTDLILLPSLPPTEPGRRQFRDLPFGREPAREQIAKGTGTSRPGKPTMLGWWLCAVPDGRSSCAPLGVPAGQGCACLSLAATALPHTRQQPNCVRWSGAASGYRPAMQGKSCRMYSSAGPWCSACVVTWRLQAA